MRGFVALVGREVRDLRWHLAVAATLGAATPWVVHGLAFADLRASTAATIGGRALVPIAFALFAAATGSDLVSREVATRRIDALAALPVPGETVWKAKVSVLLASCCAFLGLVVAAEWTAIAAVAPEGAADQFPADLLAALPSLFFGLAFGMASLFFSTLLERGMSAAFAAVAALTAAVASIEFARIAATAGDVAAFASYAVPVALAAAFAAGSWRAFTKGPIHGPSKLRVAVNGFAALVVIVVPASAALALGLGAADDLEPDAVPALRVAHVSPNGKWVAVMDDDGDGRSRTWLVSIDDGSCRAVTRGPSHFVGRGAWLAGSMLRVARTTFSVVDGPLHETVLEIEPTRLGVANEEWAKLGDLRSLEAPRDGALDGGRRVTCGRVVNLVAADGTLLRRLFPPPVAGEKGN